MDKYNSFKQGGERPTAEQLLDTKLFYQHSAEIYARYDEWKDNDRFYFIPLYMQMTYGCAGWVAEISPDPVWLGSFVRCTLEHPKLFQYKCPNCGKVVFPHRYCGSPLSGRVDLEGRCECGWRGFESVTGWRIRANALRDVISNDFNRYLIKRAFHLFSQPPKMLNLLEYLSANTDDIYNQ